jgi:phosphatidylinositol alpha-mannosyltransferase
MSQEELAAQYRAADIFIAPATGQESFGLVLLEAMSAGRAIICSDIAGFRQAGNPKGARWVPPRDVEALCRAIADLAAHPEERRRMGESNLRYVTRFEWSNLVPKIRDEYLRAMSGGPARSGWPLPMARAADSSPMSGHG